MKYVELKKYTEEQGIRSVYLFEGEERYFLEHGEEMLLKNLSFDRTLDYTSFDGATLKGEKIKQLVSALSSFPFMSEKRIVKVSEFYPTEKEYEQYLTACFSEPLPTSLLMIFNSGSGKGKKELAQLSKKPNVTYIDCGRSDEETIKRWIYFTLKREGIASDDGTCGRIAEYCLFDMSRISKETEKLISYLTAKGEKSLTDERVDELVYPDSEYKMYELSNALSRKNYSVFMRIVKELSAKGYDELSLLNSLAYYFKGLYGVSVSRGTDNEIAESLGMREFVVKKNRDQIRLLGKDEVFRLYEKLNGIIGKVKSGIYTPSSALKSAIAELLTE